MIHKTKILESVETAGGIRIHHVTCRCGWHDKSINANTLLAKFNKHVRESR